MKLHLASPAFRALLLGLFIALPAFGAPVEKKSYGTTPDGKAVDQYVLTNAGGASVSIIIGSASLSGRMPPALEKVSGSFEISLMSA